MRGHITQKRDTWYFILDVGYNENGTRKQKWFKGDVTEAKTRKMMINKIAELQQGEYLEPSQQLYRDYFDEWLKTKKRDVCKETHGVYTSYSKMFLPLIGNRKLGSITALHIDAMIADLCDAYSSSTAKKAYTLVKQSIEKAIDLGLLRSNPCDRVKPPRVYKKEMNYWAIEELQSFLFVAKKYPHYIAFYLALKTGMRKGEILALKWSDIRDKTLSVRKAKTSAGVRTIALTDTDIKNLENHRKEQNKVKLKSIRYSDNNFIIATKFGNPFNGRDLLRLFDKIIIENNLRKIRFHDLRHTHATMSMIAGDHVKVISERLGHSNISTTMDTYSHVLPNMQSESAARLEKMLEIR